MIILGVPVLSRYDLLERLLASAESGTVKPDLYLVVDNGGRFDPGNSSAIATATRRGARVEVLAAGENLGVAASWNRILERSRPYPAIVSNDDVVLGSETIEVLSSGTKEHDFVIAEGGPHANGWCLFSQTASVLETVGRYDENFYPAYYEDSDYARRLKLAGIVPVRLQSSHQHEGWMTLRQEPANGPIREGQRRSEEYFERKWGGSPDFEAFELPFDGAPVDWRKKSNAGEWKEFRMSLKRWDVVDHVAETMGRSRYLEIGVSTGETMRRARFDHKVGVDPVPTLEAVKASTVFFPIPSDDYFEMENDPFDVVFIDGLHHADQAYRDIENACALAKVVVVHDANPHTEEMQRVPYSGGDWTGDVWKAVARVRAEGQHTVRTIDADFGVAVIVPNRSETVPEFPRETWDDLVRHRVELLGLVSERVWKEEIDRACRWS